MNKRSMLSLCGLAPVAVIAPMARAMGGAPIYGEWISGTAGTSLSPLVLDTADIRAVIEAECAKFTDNLSSAEARIIAARLFGPDEVCQLITVPALDQPDR